MMRPSLVSFLLATIPLTASAADWFTVYGDVTEPDTNVIEISPYTERSSNKRLTVNVRVNRSQERDAYGGGRYRSYESVAEVDCEQRKAWYVRNVYYGLPLWQGPVTMRKSFEDGKAPLTFVEIPGEAERLVRAACLLMR